MLTLRVFQLKLVGRHIVQRRVEAFGMIDILQKRPQACLSLLKGLILVHIHFITLQHILQNFSSNAFSAQLCAFILSN